MALEDASTTKKGIVQLSSATNSTSESLAATPKAVKAAYDLANGKYTAQNATTAQKGIVQLSSATNSTSESLAATPKAVKVVMDEAQSKLSKDEFLRSISSPKPDIGSVVMAAFLGVAEGGVIMRLSRGQPCPGKALAPVEIVVGGVTGAGTMKGEATFVIGRTNTSAFPGVYQSLGGDGLYTTNGKEAYIGLFVRVG
ncbi:TPA: tail fiber protein [Escherichia coli]|nr:tail fiber protein [Escherichia coli]